MRYEHNKKRFFVSLATVALVGLFGSMLFIGCTPKKVSDIGENTGAFADSKGENIPKITKVTVNESDKESVIGIESNARLTYSAKKRDDASGIDFYIPKATIAENVQSDLKSDMLIESVKTEKFKDSIKISVLTNSDFEQAITRDLDNSIKISLQKKTNHLAVKKENNMAATKILSITTNDVDNGLRINLLGNGKISNYKKSTIDGPNPRIVFDIFNVSSDASKEKKLALKSTFAKNIRYYNHSDYVRFVIDTNSASIKKFYDYPVADGMIIDIGNISRQIASDNLKRNVLEKVDFKTDSSGKSTVQILTSRPAAYDILPSSAKNIKVALKDIFITDEQQRMVVTNRFDSAVDRIIPLYTKNNDSFINIELREDSPYRVEQNGRQISFIFDKSKDNLSVSKISAKQIPLKIPVYGYDKPAAKISKKVSEAIIPASLTSGEESSGYQYDLSNGKKKYVGEKIALDFFETDIRNVFRIIQTVSKKNFAIDTDVKGKVTMRMDEPVPWDQVLDLVLKMNALGMVQENQIIRIATLERLKSEEEMKKEVLKAQSDKAAQQKALEPIFTEYITVNYSNAKNEVMPHLKTLVTKDRGSISVDERNNQVIITDTREKIAKAREIIKSVDKVTPQVIIEARVVEATDSVSREVGTKWGASDNSNVGDSDNVFSYEMGATNLPANTAGFMGINFTRLAGNSMLLQARLEAFESTGDIKIISSPKILTLDNKEAKIEQGVEYPYLKEIDDEGKATYELKPLTLNLTVKPHVTPDNRIAMNINIKKDDVGEEIVQASSGLAGTTKTFARAFLKKEATTELLVDDGETVVIGGIVKTRTEDSSQSVPYLSKIPVLGWLFKSKIMDNERSELLLFITPRIVQLEQKS